MTSSGRELTHRGPRVGENAPDGVAESSRGRRQARRGPRLVLPQAREAVPGRVPDARARHRALHHHRRHAGPLHLLLRRAGGGVLHRARDRARHLRDRRHRRPAADLSAPAPDDGLDLGQARPRLDGEGLVHRGRASARPDQARPPDPRLRHRDPGLRRGRLLPRPRLVRHLPAPRRRVGLDRVLDDPPLPRRRGRDAAGPRRHQPRGLAAPLGPRLGAAAALAAAGDDAPDQHHHRPDRRRP